MFDKLSQLWRRLLFYAQRDQFDHELEEEMRFHLETKAEENLAAGISPEGARYAAQRQFGNQTILREVSREMWGIRSIETLFQDLRFGIRMFLKSPGLTTLLILTIALGIGFNSAIFSVVNTLLLNPLPFPDADRLVIAWTRSAKTSSNRLGVTPEEFADWQKQNQSFVGVAAQAYILGNLSGTDEPERIQARRVSTNFFSIYRRRNFALRIPLPPNPRRRFRTGAMDACPTGVLARAWSPVSDSLRAPKIGPSFRDCAGGARLLFRILTWGGGFLFRRTSSGGALV